MVFAMTFVGVGLQVAIFVKLKRLETQPHGGNKWVVSFSARDGVNLEVTKQILPEVEDVIRHTEEPDLTGNDGHTASHRTDNIRCKVWLHRRNVISPVGNCASFVACQIWFLGVSYHIFNLSDLESPTVLDFLLFVTPSVDFFVLNLIETLCSPTLRKSLFSWCFKF